MAILRIYLLLLFTFILTDVSEENPLPHPSPIEEEQEVTV
jgi:hypothetical protein